MEDLLDHLPDSNSWGACKVAKMHSTGGQYDVQPQYNSDLSKLREDVAQLLKWQDRVDKDLYNGGKDGMKQKLTELEKEYTVTERTRKEDHQENRAKLNLIIYLFLAFITLLGFVLTYEKYHEHSLLHSHPLRTDNSPAFAQAEKRYPNVQAQ